MKHTNSPMTYMIVLLIVGTVGSCIFESFNSGTGATPSLLPEFLPATATEDRPIASIEMPTSTESVKTATTMPTATQYQCEAGYVVFTARSEGRYDSGIYLSCADGTILQLIYQFTMGEDGFSEESPNRLSAVNGRPSVLFTYLDSADDETPWHITEIDLNDHTSRELRTQENYMARGQLSPGEQYLAYVTQFPSELNGPGWNTLEFVHLETQTVSRITLLDHNYDIWNFDWSDNGDWLLLEIIGPLGQAQEHKVYTLDIQCDSHTFTCEQGELEMISESLVDPSWLDNSLQFIGISEYHSDTSQVIQTVNLEGSIIQEYDLVEGEPYIENVDSPTMSPDGTRIAFYNFFGVYILNTVDYSITTIDIGSPASYSFVEWVVPE